MTALARAGVDAGAIVQDRAAHRLPPTVAPVIRPTSAGARRALHGLLPAPDCEVVHALDVDLPYRTGRRRVVTVHDLAVFDVPDTMSSVRAAAERRLVASSLRRAHRVIAVSSFTASRVAERFGVGCDVVPLAARPGLTAATGADVAEIRRRHDLPARFVLHLGTVEPRKSLGDLATACRRVGVPLVLAGARWSDAPTDGDVRALGFVPDDDVVELLGACALLAVSSRYEGFCLPAVEAMALGVPVVATRVGALGDLVPTAGLVAPGDVTGLADAIGELLADDEARARHGEAGRQVAGRRSWDDVAAETIVSYRRAGARLRLRPHPDVAVAPAAGVAATVADVPGAAAT